MFRESRRSEDAIYRSSEPSLSLLLIIERYEARSEITLCNLRYSDVSGGEAEGVFGTFLLLEYVCSGYRDSAHTFYTTV
jgi:hypothetical protein